ncbi:MAG: OmpA family protein [Alphaproteobacteria bacterium]|nr:OmpA family protein [Alphaproteobacteria bacterium]
MLNIRYKEKTNAWPGFVDLFSNLVIILIFLLIVFVFLWTTTSVFNKNSGIRTVTELRQTNAEQAALIQQMENEEQEAKRLLLMAREEINSNEAAMAAQSASVNDLSNAYEQKLQALESQTASLQAQVTELQSNRNLTTQYEEQIAELEKQVNRQKNERATLIAQIDDLQKKLDAQADVQVAVSNAEMEKLQFELSRARADVAAVQAEYINMSNHLNRALADKVAELNEMAQYQSEFYRAIKDAIGDRTIMRPDGDRFIISSDILFQSGKYSLSPDGKKQLAAIANVIKDFENKIAPNVKWIIRVDGHTDNKPVVAGTHGYRDNLQLSMLRASAVVDELAKNGVSRRRLVPSGFGDLHPIELGKTPAALQKNRRIELQLTNR